MIYLFPSDPLTPLGESRCPHYVFPMLITPMARNRMAMPVRQ